MPVSNVSLLALLPWQQTYTKPTIHNSSSNKEAYCLLITYFFCLLNCAILCVNSVQKWHCYVQLNVMGNITLPIYPYHITTCHITPTKLPLPYYSFLITNTKLPLPYYPHHITHTLLPWPYYFHQITPAILPPPYNPYLITLTILLPPNYPSILPLPNYLNITPAKLPLSNYPTPHYPCYPNHTSMTLNALYYDIAGLIKGAWSK